MRTLALAPIVALLAAACGNELSTAPIDSSPAVNRLLTAADLSGYERALEPRDLVFPRDHASHPDFKTEWWYFTGHVTDAEQRAFGFQLTFFRFALASTQLAPRSAWRSRQAWMAHLAITDVANAKFIHAERFSRDGLGLAGNAQHPFRIWLEDWSATAAGSEAFPLRLAASTAGAGLELVLTATRPPIAHGDRGLDRKGPEPGNASYYYSMPRLAVEGELRLGGERRVVSGSAWMDREWSTNALSAELVGWDWLSLELDDGRDLMLYRLRLANGASSPFSSGALVAADGSTMPLSASDFALAAREFWTSPVSGARYPVGWDVDIRGGALRFEVRPLIPNQEINLAVRYWEGAVSARGVADGVPVSGRGYLELTGY